jgi:leucyl-tRNA synthetase
VTEDIERFHLNRYVAHLREFTNAIEDFSASEPSEMWTLHEALHTLVLLISPALPHLAETLWAELGHPPFIYNAPWPKADSALLTEESFKLAVQVNGKMRGTIEVEPHLGEEDIKRLILDLPLVKAQVQEKAIKKFIYIPGKVANVVL